MITHVQGDILRADAEALVNTVNCVGFMGRGIAAQFSRAYPGNLKAYEAACKRQEVQPGRMLVYATGQLMNPRYIINFPTKRHWRGKSRIEDVEAGLGALVSEVQGRGIRSIAVPPLGCGLGGLSWDDVRPRIERAFADLPDVRVLVYGPAGAPAADVMARSVSVPKMTSGRAVLIGLMHSYLAGLMEPFISLLEVHKLMYFAQEAGEELRLRYTKATYGPYAENLRHVLKHIEGHFVSGYADGGDAPDKLLEIVPGAIDDARRFLASAPATNALFERVVELVEGFETPFGMELLATVHWVATREMATGADAAIELVYRWNARKRRFSEHQIRLAWDTLAGKGWLRAA
ncbi:type II toxin-antitoxin system antitoxin DNA ADP-ribosyl glycohydrolase DarG [Nannocystis punicea]|uniref:Macro domain-containing protein n=1 Tax=Nannocystis punicea TaxID=2995304 RepID=A0ABY7HEC3_9BACT|nr:macro domain-containing protein [Nannocystis poenicansa]WAS97435.1 macro domain-containing protein [Nannocystis poenicansa]